MFFVSGPKFWPAYLFVCVMFGVRSSHVHRSDGGVFGIAEDVFGPVALGDTG